MSGARVRTQMVVNTTVLERTESMSKRGEMTIVRRAHSRRELCAQPRPLMCLNTHRSTRERQCKEPKCIRPTRFPSMIRKPTLGRILCSKGRTEGKTRLEESTDNEPETFLGPDLITNSSQERPAQEGGERDEGLTISHLETLALVFASEEARDG